jgi:hypothetical protein
MGFAFCWGVGDGEEVRPIVEDNVEEGCRRIRRYISADMQLRALWQIPMKRAEWNLWEDLPSIVWKGTDTK